MLVKGITPLVTVTVLIGAFACSNDNHAHGSSGGSNSGGPPRADAGHGLVAFTPPDDPGAGGVLFSASGEALALTGYAFPPVQDGDAAFVDGWDMHFQRLLVTVDKIRLASSPDTSPGDQSKTGKVVAEVDGPWAIDLAHSDPGYLLGKGGPGEEAVPIAALSAQNKNGNGGFATDGTRYAFGFDVVAASSDITPYNVNLDAAALADYDTMRADGCAVLYVGTATFKGDKTDPDCYPDSRKSWPDVVDFRLCFKSPTTYANCQNPDNDPADPFPDEEHERGIAFKDSSSVIAQVTIHTDHPFWDSVIHDSPAHFDQFAARVVGADAGTPAATLEQTVGVDYTAYTDALGNALDYRYCVEPPTDAHPKFVGAMRFDPGSVPHATNDDPASGLRDYHDFSTYDQSTQGHLNADGLCYVARRYPSPR
ncbi:MAG TPA: hypothetical protein VH062_29070 [Polyangiaceae bacterium]|jgi:hypothetical protein|nr:hypothetical protein [Polyangiaceae bacterium]